MKTAPAKPAFTSIVVDDNEFQRILAKRCLERLFKEHHFSFSIKEAEDGKKAWEICKEKEFDFYVIDFQMPVMNGVALCRKLFNMYPNAKVVLYSDANIEDIEKEEGFIKEKHINEFVDLIPKDCLKLEKHLKLYIERSSIEKKFQNSVEPSENKL